MLDFIILLVVGFILWKVHVMGAELERLRLEVEQQESAIDSAITLINGLSAALRDALVSGDTAAIAELADRLDASGTKLATAVAANTAADDDSNSFYDGEPIDDDDNDDGQLFDLTDESTDESTTERAGEGVTGADSAEDTSATTTQPVYDDAGAGNGDSSGQPSTGSTTDAESSGSTEAESSDSSDENGNAAA
jgi:hypothetical protein